MGRQQWEVVGGADKGGIVVRAGEGGSAPQCAERLSTGAIVEEVQIKASRLEYVLKKGTGPQTGWVAIALPGKELMRKMDTPPGGGAHAEVLVIPGGEVTKKAWEDYLASWDGEVPPPPESRGDQKPMNEFIDEYFKNMYEGKIKPFYMGAGRPEVETPEDEIDQDFEALRKSNEEKRQAMKTEPPLQPLPPYIKWKMVEVIEKAPIATPGDMYGLPVPSDLAELYEFGAEWLTKAFHAAGTLPKDNRITKMVDFKRLPMGGIDAKGGSGPKAFITVEYEKFDLELHNQLFVKMPWSVKGENHAMGEDQLWRWKISCFQDNDGQEVTVYRMLGPLLPFKIPKFYFADICRCSTNFILITEQLQFGKKGQTEFEPYEAQPLAEKYFDFQLPLKMRTDMYYCLVRAQARMAAWDKNGMFDGVPIETRGYMMSPPGLEIVAPGWPRKLPEKKRNVELRKGKALRDLWEGFLTKNAKKALPKHFTQPKFVEAICEAAYEGAGYFDDIWNYFSLFPEYTGMMHSNLQSDNAYYWRNAKGELDCGIIDWGGLSPRHVVNAFMGCITSALGEVLDAHEDGLIECWQTEYWKECGIWTDFGELKRQWQLGLMTYIRSCGTNIQAEVYRQVPEPEWQTITTLMDERTAGQWNTRCYVFMIFHLLKYLYFQWKRNGESKLPCFEFFMEWKSFWIARGLE